MQTEIQDFGWPDTRVQPTRVLDLNLVILSCSRNRPVTPYGGNNLAETTKVVNFPKYMKLLLSERSREMPSIIRQ